jgi:hypothetical protein
MVVLGPPMHVHGKDRTQIAVLRCERLQRIDSQGIKCSAAAIDPHDAMIRSFGVEPGEDRETNPGVYGRSFADWLADRLPNPKLRRPSPALISRERLM